MVISDPPVPAPRSPPAPAPRPDRARAWPELASLGVLGAAALLLAVLLAAYHLGGLGGIVPASVVSLVLFIVCGDALAVALLPPAWRALVPLFAAALGSAASGLALTVLGFAHVPLTVSVWVTLIGGVTASVAVRRRREAPRWTTAARRRLATWTAALLVVFCVALIPALASGSDTIYGLNPDAHQVVGIAVLFQHVAPQGTDKALPIDTVPPSWRFRYPIFYPLAAASELAHLDPIRVFPAMAALLLATAALGFGALAVACLAAPVAAGPAIAGVIGLSWVPLHLAWHPYWNQLWGFALLPYAVLFGWHAVAARDRRSAALFALMTVALALAYPLAAPYPLVIVGAVALALGRRPRRPRIAGRRAWLTVAIGLLILAPALAGAAVKLEQGLRQLFSAHSALWSGDIRHLTPVGRFVGTGGGIVPALAVLLLAASALRALPRRVGICIGLTLLVLLAVDLRFRVVRGGGYMDFKHMSYVGVLVLVLAAGTVARWLASGSRRAIAAGLLVAGAWVGAALVQDRREARATGEQVTPELLGIRAWSHRLPRGASVRIDIPASGEQLWAVYMLGAHPVDAPDPVLGTTYAHAPAGVRADYSLSWRCYPSPDPRRCRPVAPVGFAQSPPLLANAQYVLRRIVWPSNSARYGRIPDTSSTALVEP